MHLVNALLANTRPNCIRVVLTCLGRGLQRESRNESDVRQLREALQYFHLLLPVRGGFANEHSHKLQAYHSYT